MAMIRQVIMRKATCPMFGCGATVEVTTSVEMTVCDVCATPWWPLELGFTGNDPEKVNEFARTHNFDGTPR